MIINSNHWVKTLPLKEGWYWARKINPKSLLTERPLPSPGTPEIVHVSYGDTKELCVWGIYFRGAPLNDFEWFAHDKVEPTDILLTDEVWNEKENTD